MLTVVLLVLGVACTVFAEDCKKVKPMDNFSLKKMSGYWYISSVAITNPEAQAKYRGLRCGVRNFNVVNEDSKPNNFTIDMFIGKEQYIVSGLYELPNPTKGYFPINVSDGKMTKPTYDYTILCTDYTSYLVDYACLQIAPGESSAFSSILTRNPITYGNIIAKPEVRECFAQISSKPIEEMVFTVPYHNCPNFHHFFH